MYNLSGSWGTFSFQRWNLLHADLSVMSRQRGQSVVVSWQSSTIRTEVVLDCWIFWRSPDFCLNVSVAYVSYTFTAIGTFIHFWCHYCNHMVINILKTSWKQSRKCVRWYWTDSVCLMLLQVAFCQSFHQHLPILMLDHWTPDCWKFYWIGWNSNNVFCLCVLPAALWCFILVSAGTFLESSFIVGSCHVLLKQTWVFPELHRVVMSVFLLAVYDGSLRLRIRPHHLARNDVLPGFESIHCQTILTF